MGHLSLKITSMDRQGHSGLDLCNISYADESNSNSSSSFKGSLTSFHNSLSFCFFLFFLFLLSFFCSSSITSVTRTLPSSSQSSSTYTTSCSSIYYTLLASSSKWSESSSNEISLPSSSINFVSSCTFLFAFNICRSPCIMFSDYSLR